MTRALLILILILQPLLLAGNACAGAPTPQATDIEIACCGDTCCCGEDGCLCSLRAPTRDQAPVPVPAPVPDMGRLLLWLAPSAPALRVAPQRSQGWRIPVCTTSWRVPGGDVQSAYCIRHT